MKGGIKDYECNEPSKFICHVTIYVSLHVTIIHQFLTFSSNDQANQSNKPLQWKAVNNNWTPVTVHFHNLAF